MRIPGIDRFDERGDGCAWGGAQQTGDDVTCPCALDRLAHDARLVPKRLPLALTSNQPFLAQPVDHLCGRGVDQALRHAELLVQLAHGRRAKAPQLAQDCVLQVI